MIWLVCACGASSVPKTRTIPNVIASPIPNVTSFGYDVNIFKILSFIDMFNQLNGCHINTFFLSCNL